MVTLQSILLIIAENTSPGLSGGPGARIRGRGESQPIQGLKALREPLRAFYDAFRFGPRTRRPRFGPWNPPGAILRAIVVSQGVRDQKAVRGPSTAFWERPQFLLAQAAPSCAAQMYSQLVWTTSFIVSKSNTPSASRNACSMIASEKGMSACILAYASVSSR